MLEKTFDWIQNYETGELYTPAMVAEKAIRNLFSAIQEGCGKPGNIRLRKKFIEITIEGTVTEYSNNGHKAILITRTYDALVRIEGEDELAYQQSLYVSPDFS